MQCVSYFDTTHMPRFPLAANESGDQELIACRGKA